jgi:hypothetical protein
MSYTWFLIFSCSIFVGALIGLLRFRTIATAFYPFIFCLWIGALNEIISITLPRLGYTTAVNNNIYVLLEAGLLLWQLKNWGGFRGRHGLFSLIIIIFLITWSLEQFVFFTITYPQPYFRIGYSLVIVLLAVHVNNRVMLFEKNQLNKNAVFLICIGLVIYFTYKVLVEVFWLYGLHSSAFFRINVYSIWTWINLIVNCIYALAVVWIPKKQPYIRLF